VLKPFVENRGTKPPESANLDTCNFAVPGHLLKSLGVDLEESSRLATVEQLFKDQFTNLNITGWLGSKKGHCDLRSSFMHQRAARAA
jgi:hypothetical protein